MTEELLAAGAPVSAHWIADRQSGPLLLRYGTTEQQERYLPGVTRGESFFSIGMSEPDSGSDLASVRCQARRVDGGWRVSGTKLWTTDAHRNHYIIALVRTEPVSDNRHAGLSQLIIGLHDEDVDVRPILNMAGGEDFNEVVFNDCFVPDDQVVGEPGNGWQQGPIRNAEDAREWVSWAAAQGIDGLKLGAYDPHIMEALIDEAKKNN